MRNNILALLAGIILGGLFFGSTVGRHYITLYAAKVGINFGNSITATPVCPVNYTCKPVNPTT